MGVPRLLLKNYAPESRRAVKDAPVGAIRARTGVPASEALRPVGEAATL